MSSDVSTLNKTVKQEIKHEQKLETKFEVNKKVVLVGAPNSGKTTLYNWLTGSHFKTVNYPGATVEYSKGLLISDFGQDTLIVDTPGVYSLFPKSEDEIVTYNVITGQAPDIGKIDLVVVVIDGTQMSRHFTLVEQVKSLGIPLLLVVTMEDLLSESQIQVDKSLLQSEFQCPVMLFDGLLGKGLKEITQNFNRHTEGYHLKDLTSWDEAIYERKNQYYAELATRALKSVANGQNKLNKISQTTRKVDYYLLHPIFGFVFFLGIMTLLFSSIFFFAQPLMDLVDWAFSSLAAFVDSSNLSVLAKDFLSSGVISGVASVMVFVPQIFILFFGIGILESTGYLARAATIIDKPFSKLGLTGRSFVPMLSGFACAVPAIMSTRNISSKRDRLITSLVIPLMTCSARLPVYALLLAFLFYGESAWKPGVMLALVYIMSMVLGAFASAILNKILPKKEKSFLLMELPIYRRPLLKVILRQAGTRTISYVKKAGVIIFLFSIVIWGLTNFPAHELQNKSERLEKSYASQLGQAIEPIFTPMGADWRVGVGLLTAFSAREVFVSSLAVLFNVESSEDELQDSLLNQMQSATFANGEKLFTVASVMALIVFFMIAMQCVSTFAIFLKEMSSLKLATLQLLIYNLMAYVAAVMVYQILR